MTITIPFPTNFEANNYADIKGYLKQLSLSIVHAQKAVENAEKDGIKVSEDAYVCFEHPMLDNNNLDVSETPEMKDFTLSYYNELQKVELKINLE